ncbi:MAG: GNAT family N-acetyltransferase [Planctomycetota bacterium]
MQIERISINSPHYPGACALRQEVLLDEIEYTIERFRSEYPGVEEAFEHFVAIDDKLAGDRNGVVGVVCLHPKLDATPREGKLMQMAVDDVCRGRGVGRLLVDALMDRATGLGLDRVYCHARLDACGFYERLGWTYDSDLFMEAGIEHRRMVAPS